MRPEPDLRVLARLWEVQPGYVDLEGRLHPASRDSLVAILRALGAPLPDDAGPRAVADALLARRHELSSRLVEPVVVAWEGRLQVLALRLPRPRQGGRVSVRFELEGGDAETLRFPVEELGVRERVVVEGRPVIEVEVPLRRRLPLGYHRLEVASGGRRAHTLVIAAPRRAPSPPRPIWGIFGPLYAMHSASSLGVGDFRDLHDFMAWIDELGGSVVGTLPLFATFLDEPFEPSPYSPITRRFWNEAFIDVRSLPELHTSAATRAGMSDTAALLEGACELPLVDYAGAVAAKRRVLAAAAKSLEAGGRRRDELEAFAAAHPELETYAGFRAAGERFRTPWEQWPSPAREGRLASEDAPAEARAYHRYVQWIAAGQLHATRRVGGVGLMLDLPLGVHPAGYDVWRERDVFLTGVTAGAPPDPLNPKGQDWGNLPLHPEAIRRTGYAYPIACVRELMAVSSILRIDHVMGLHRLFVLPAGGDARDGVYIRHRPEEGYAILSLEAARAGTTVVGEDLGTVPAAVRRLMRRHGVLRTYIAKWAVGEDGLQAPPPDSVASIGTHDMAPFAAFWRGSDIEERYELGVVGADQAAREAAMSAEVRERLVAALVAEGLLGGVAPTEGEVLDAWLAFLAASPASAVLVSLEDLWAETACQNIPGTVGEHPNWRRRMRYPLEAVRSLPEVVGRLSMVDDLRRRAQRDEEGL